MNGLAEKFRALGDETRLRILRLLQREALNVGELTRILGVAQPTVSKHLGELKKAGLVENSRRGGFSFYSLSPQLGDLWQPLSRELAGLAVGRGDLVRLQQVLQLREEREEADRFVVPGRSWVVWSRALRFLLPGLRVADFGCGDGTFTVEMAAWAREVIAVDSNPAYLRLAREAAQGLNNVRFLQEDMTRVSLPEGCVDLVVLSQSLHYLEEPWLALREAHRILVPGGRCLIIELLPHREDWVRQELQHRWLGLDPVQLGEWLRQEGFDSVQLDEKAGRNVATFPSFVVAACKEVA